VETAKEVSREKPIVVYKAGRSTDSARAAQSHTGALSSDWRLYQGVFRQTNIIASPAMELLLPLAHSLVERPQIEGNRIAVVTMGGSWGVALVDCLAEHGLGVPEFSPAVQERLRGLGLIARASAKNPVDFGASGRFVDTEFLISLCREILHSKEVDALVIHGFGNAGMNVEGSQTLDFFHEVQIEQVVGIAALEKEFNLPVLFGNPHSQWESQVVNDLNQLGIRVYNRLSDIGVLLSGMHDYWCQRSLRS
jgi:acyl-CoA synthetase (NDP forming)